MSHGLVKIIYVLGSFSGIFPSQAKFLVKRVHLVTLILTDILGTISIMCEVNLTFSHTQLSLEDLWLLQFFLVWPMFIAVCLYNACKNIEIWNTFFEMMKQVNNMKLKTRKSKKIILLLLLVFVFASLSVYLMVQRGKERCNVYIFGLIFWLILISNIVFLTIMTNETCHSISNTYIGLKMLLEETYNIDNIIKDESPQNVTAERQVLQNITDTIVSLYKCVVILNTILGKIILMFFVLTFVDVLAFVNICLIVIKHYNTELLSIHFGNILESVSFLVFSLAIILSCDKVEKTSKELINTCTYIYASKGSEDALMLLNLAKELRPKFTAAGFFEINQRLLPTFLSNLSTYLIIILQFKFSAL
ncbi:uncharacterized protein LOC114324962 isoform X2 [Diabrotica virgifera virgifera]|uniref:Gustatory receptor n=1 Tax=Diabrotica virgifera virgifera TaxID=50390 RepID=A0A6P7F4G1_DIAVI|nr:uncharacterized protein LOC114324962 isoform X2 [Diabrotica virgifera virgifera]